MERFFPPLYLLEIQLYGAEFALIFLTWWTDDIGFSIIWYFLTVLEYLIQVAQWLFQVVGPTEHVDLWGTPLIVPSYALTMGITVLTYGGYYYWWWRRKPSGIAIVYTSALTISLVYIAVALEYAWWQVMASVVFGLAYGFGTSLLIRYEVVPTWIPMLTQCIQPSDGFPWTYLFGTRNTLFPPTSSARTEI